MSPEREEKWVWGLFLGVIFAGMLFAAITTKLRAQAAPQTMPVEVVAEDEPDCRCPIARGPVRRSETHPRRFVVRLSFARAADRDAWLQRPDRSAPYPISAIQAPAGGGRENVLPPPVLATPPVGSSAKPEPLPSESRP